MKKVIIFIVLIVLLTGCASSENISQCVDSDPYGFFSGFWHAIILPISFIGSIISDHISIYAINNNGGWYDLGFILGIGFMSGSTYIGITYKF